MIKLAYTQVWVHDQDEALKFYTEKLGMEVRTDVTVPELGGFRWLAVGPVGQTDVSIVLMAIPGPPVMDEATADQVREVMAKGFAGAPVPDDRGLPGELRGTARPRCRVRRGARAAPVRHRLGLPRPVRQPHPAGPDHVVTGHGLVSRPGPIEGSGPGGGRGAERAGSPARRAA